MLKFVSTVSTRLRTNRPDSLSGKVIRCGAMATTEMKKLVNGYTITCQQTDTDRYGRVVAICSAEGIDIGQRLVQSGWAVAYRRYSAR